MEFEMKSGFGIVGVVLFLIPMAFVHLAFAGGVYQAASERSEAESLWFVSPTLWALATLLGGVPIAAVYWAIHHSTLSRMQ